jgi:DNA-binding transcriptional ArsR family regulator/enamine deaminase RidA (YjgF/YER057c/UK114 family)
MARAATNSDSFNAVAEPRRREILNYLALQERAVGDIVLGLEMEQPSVSKHLLVLRNVGLVRVRRNGRQMFCRTNAVAIRPLHEWTKAFEALWQHQLIRGKEPAAGYLEKEKNMSTRSKATALIRREHSELEGAEQRLKELGLKLPAPPEPFGTYAEAVQTGKLLFLTGMLPTEGRGVKFIGRVGVELNVEAGRKAARLAALNALAVARRHLGSLDKVTRIVRLGVSVATWGDVRDQPKVADAASELLQEVFGKEKNPCRLVYGVASLPLGTPVELEVIFEVG